MPVHRHVHDKLGSVYAFRSDLDAWMRGRLGQQSSEAVSLESAPASAGPPAETAVSLPPRRRRVWLLGGAAAVLAACLILWPFLHGYSASENPLAEARFLPLTDFGGTEQAAALTRDGRFVAFLSDRDGQVDVWVTQVGAGQFYNLTRGAVPDLVNPSVRTLGFSPDGALVTFWTRKSEGTGPSSISIWAVPVLGGAPRPYLEGVAEFDWSRDGSRLVYHTPGTGDPMFVRDAGQAQGRQIFSAPAGLHGHFPVWSPDQAFIYFVQGSVPDRMDIWRIRPAGGPAERITNHDSRVSHPVFLDNRTLLYLATDSDGSGPWLHSLDTERPRPHRVSGGLEKYSSLAVSADGGRLVATLASPKAALWRVPVAATAVQSSVLQRISLTTGSGSAPRMGPGYLLYISSKGQSDSIWRLQGEQASELWSAPETRIIGSPAISRDGNRISFSARRNRQTSLYVANADGTNTRIVTSSLELQGSPAFAPDGQSITVAALVDGAPRLFTVPLDGRPPARLVEEHSIDPVWSPDGELVVYSGPDIGTTFPVKAVTGNAIAASMPKLTLSRGARRMAFMPNTRSLVVLRGEIEHKNLWLIDLNTGLERQLTDFEPGFTVRDFDVSPDGREIVIEQAQAHSDIVLIELTRR
jgi:Tol biopolymer transport system component